METTTMGSVGIMGYRLVLGLECWALRFSGFGPNGFKGGY